MSAGAHSDHNIQLSLTTVQSPNNSTLEMPSLEVPPSIESTPLVGEPLAYYVELGNPDNILPPSLEHPTPGKLDDGFPSLGLNLEIDDFKWFTPVTSQVEQCMVATPPAAAELSTHPSCISGDAKSYSSLGHAHIEPSFMPYSPPVHHAQGSQQPCLCDPLSLGIISELQTFQLSLSPLDTALLLARRGLSIVSSYITCPWCINHLSSSPSLFLACVLILQQVFTCYMTLRLQGARMLTSLCQSRKRADSSQAAVCIGDFEVDGEESCNVLLDAIIRAEMERGKSVISNLEEWAEKVGEGKEKISSVLLQLLREDIGGVC